MGADARVAADAGVVDCGWGVGFWSGQGLFGTE